MPREGVEEEARIADTRAMIGRHAELGGSRGRTSSRRQLSEQRRPSRQRMAGRCGMAPFDDPARIGAQHLARTRRRARRTGRTASRWSRRCGQARHVGDQAGAGEVHRPGCPGPSGRRSGRQTWAPGVASHGEGGHGGWLGEATAPTIRAAEHVAEARHRPDRRRAIPSHGHDGTPIEPCGPRRSRTLLKPRSIEGVHDRTPLIVGQPGRSRSGSAGSARHRAPLPEEVHERIDDGAEGGRGSRPSA